MFQQVIIVTILLPLVFSIRTVQNVCREPEEGASNFEYTQCKMLQLENSLHHIESAQNIDTQRQAAMARVFSDQFTKLHSDVNVTKTVLTTVVEDNVNIQGKLRVMQGVNTDIDNLRWQLQNDNNRQRAAIDGQSNKLDALVKSVNTDIDNLRWQLQNDNNRQRAAIDGQSNKLDALVDKTAGLEGKLTQMKNDLDRLKQTSSSQQTGGSGETTTGLVTELRETIQSLTTQLQGLEDKMNSQLVAVRNEIEEMKKENRRSAAYPWQ